MLAFGYYFLFDVFSGVCPCMSVSVRAKIACNLLGLFDMLNPKSECISVSFDLDL